jgi:hypothetical protein
MKALLRVAILALLVASGYAAVTSSANPTGKFGPIPVPNMPCPQ